MSREKREKRENFEKKSFTARFVEVCGTSEPARIQRLLEISYQAAKNYLNGRLPDPHVLTAIAERTPFSIHWLLTGEGEKFSVVPMKLDTISLTRQIREIVRQECVEIVNEILAGKIEAQPKVVVLQPGKLKSEKAHEKSNLPVEQTDERTNLK